MQGEASKALGQAPDIWDTVLENWRHIGRPLKPYPDDIAVYERFARVRANECTGRLRALMLGVTPEIAGCRWPAGTNLIAVDCSPAMIHGLWPAPGTPADARVLCADWRTMPIDSGSIDYVCGDGCNPALPFPDVMGAVARSVLRILAPGGLFAMRLFSRPEPAETVDDISRALAAGRIGNVHVLKWRLIAALTGKVENGVRLGDVWNVWNGMRSLVARYGAVEGWTAGELNSIEMYLGMETRFYFPTLAEYRALLAPDFVERECSYGPYELGDRCPIVCFAKRNAPS